MFKKTKIWLGWVGNKPNGRTALYLLSLIGLFFIALLVIFLLFDFGIIPLSERGKEIFSPWLTPWVEILIGVVGVLLSLPWFISTVYCSSVNNFKVAIDEALKFKEKHFKCSLRIDEFIRITRDTEDAASMNQWIKDYGELMRMERDKKELEEEQERIPAQIKKKEERIRILKRRLDII